MKQRSALGLPMPATYFLLVLRQHGGSPEAAAALLAGTGVDPERLAAQGEITLGQQLVQFRNLADREAPGWGLEAGSGFQASTHGRLGARAFVVAHVEEVLAAAGDAGLGVEETARRLHLSRRTLARRLAEAGTSFREVLDAHHKERAEILLRDPSLDVAEVGWRRRSRRRERARRSRAGGRR